jgi:hypothetical protein
MKKKYIYGTKTLTYILHYWGAFCQGAFVIDATYISWQDTA